MRPAQTQSPLNPLAPDQNTVQPGAMKQDKANQDEGADAQRRQRLELIRYLAEK